jgi:hypothetical protein
MHAVELYPEIAFASTRTKAGNHKIRRAPKRKKPPPTFVSEGFIFIKLRAWQ